MTPKATTYQKNKIAFYLKHKMKDMLGIREPVSMQQILDRFVADSPHEIQCDKGWYPLIISIHQELAHIDQNYQILQIKEKFGGLRFYYVSNSKKHSEIDRIVHFYENKSYEICEVTGKPGQLMRKGGTYKTLHSSFYNEGWNFV